MTNNTSLPETENNDDYTILPKLYTFIVKKFCTFVGIVSYMISFGVICIVYGLMYFTNNIPDYDSLATYNPPVITRLYSQSLDVIAEYAYEPRIFAKVSDMPQLLINAFVAAEDKTFFENYGIDSVGILRATIQNIANFSVGKRMVGGSTITQQVVKGFITGNQKTLDRKIGEAILAYRISIAYSKEKILELYLNQIFLGNNSYGVAMAAKNYFGKELSELNIAEAAMLASLPKAPSSLNPYVNPDRTLERRNWVIKRMYEENMIYADEATEYSKYPINVLPRVRQQYNSSELFYTEEVKKQLIKFYGEEAVYTDGLTVNTNLDHTLQKHAVAALQGGIETYDKRHGWRGPLGKIKDMKNWQNALKDFTKQFSIGDQKFIFAVVLSVSANAAYIGINTADLRKYDIADNTKHCIPLVNMKWARVKLNNGGLGGIVKSANKVLKIGDVIAVSIDAHSTKKSSKEILYHLEQIPAVNGAMVVIQNYTGKVLAMVGGYDGNNTYFNRVTQAKRQPGSAFKTLIYLAAIENGFSSDSILMDEPIAVSQGNGMPLWTPKNLTHKFNGAVTLQEAFVRSLNIPSIQIGLTVGLDKIYEVASRLGVYPKPARYDIPCSRDVVAAPYCKNYSLLLGAFETTLFDITRAYATIASSGYDIAPSLIGSIYDSKGNLLYHDHNVSLVYNDAIISTDVVEHDVYMNSDSNVKTQPSMRYFRQKLVKSHYNAKIIELLESVIAPQNKILQHTLAGKSGTTNNSFDTWFIGMSSDFTVGVFVGFDSPSTLGKKEIGATVAKPIFMDFMRNALQGITDRPIGKVIPNAMEFINIDSNDEDGENINSDEKQIESELISEILKIKPEILNMEFRNECEDCEDAYRVDDYNDQQ